MRKTHWVVCHTAAPWHWATKRRQAAAGQCRVERLLNSAVQKKPPATSSALFSSAPTRLHPSPLPLPTGRFLSKRYEEGSKKTTAKTAQAGIRTQDLAEIQAH